MRSPRNPVRFKALLLRIREHGVRELLRVGGRQFFQIETLKTPMHANLWRRARRDMQIGAVDVDDLLQEFE